MGKIKTVFLIVVSMACGWYLRGFVVAITNRTASIQMEKSLSPAKRQSISRSRLRTEAANIDQLLSKIRIVPYFANGVSAGLKILMVQSPSIFEELGLKRGDILQKINNEPISIENGVTTFEKLKAANLLDLQISRAGFSQTLSYEIVE